jgi:hypothetical protein
MLSGVHCPLQLRQQIGYGAVQVVRKIAYRSPVARVWLNPDRLEQQGRRDMARVGNEWNGHPRPNRLVRGVEMPGLFAGPEGEEESACDRKQEGDSKNQYAPPGFSHNSI